MEINWKDYASYGSKEGGMSIQDGAAIRSARGINNKQNRVEQLGKDCEAMSEAIKSEVEEMQSISEDLCDYQSTIEDTQEEIEDLYEEIEDLNAKLENGTITDDERETLEEDYDQLGKNIDLIKSQTSESTEKSNKLKDDRSLKSHKEIAKKYSEETETVAKELLKREKNFWWKAGKVALGGALAGGVTAIVGVLTGGLGLAAIPGISATGGTLIGAGAGAVGGGTGFSFFKNAENKANKALAQANDLSSTIDEEIENFDLSSITNTNINATNTANNVENYLNNNPKKNNK